MPLSVDGVQLGHNNVASGTSVDTNGIADTNNGAQTGVQHGPNNAVEDDLDDTLQSDEYVDVSMYEPDETVIQSTNAEMWSLDRMRARSANPMPPSLFAFLLYESMATNNEPTTVREALNGDDRENWKSAMHDEYHSLIDNQTWKLVDLPRGCKPINNKWVFKRKTNSKGETIRYKARLVAKGCSQREGIDFVETYSPAVRYTSIRLLIAMAVKLNLKIEQMDAVTAFLHGDVHETIYMRQPEMFDDESGKVCQLSKALYGLKQASRQWNIKLNEVLLRAGYKRCKKDACIYVHRNGESMVIVAVYVDDLLIFFNRTAWKDQLKSTLTKHFKMKELGQASNILGINIEIDRANGSI